MKPAIIIQVSGGVAEATAATAPIDVLLVDWDNIKGGDSFPVPATPPILTAEKFNEKLLAMQADAKQMRGDR